MLECKVSSLIEKDYETEISTEDMTIDLQVGGEVVKALIDTGSSLTLVSEKLIERLTNVTTESTSLKEVVGICNLPKKILGRVNLEMGVDDAAEVKVECYILENMTQDIILGRDFLGKNVNCINISNAKLCIKKKQIRKLLNCMVTDDHVLMPHSMVCVEATVDDGWTGHGVLAEESNMLNRGILIEKIPGKIENDGKVQCNAYNITGKRVYLKRKETLGFLKVINLEDMNGWNIQGDHLSNQE